MNQKRCKALRAAAQYRNQTATPGTMPFPGIMPRGYHFPVLARITKQVRVFNRVKGQPRQYEEVKRIVNSGTWAASSFISNRRVKALSGKSGRSAGVRKAGATVVCFSAEPVFMLNKDGTPAYQIMPVSKPGRLNAKEPKGIYRALKRIDRKFGVQQFATAMAIEARKAATAKGVA